MRMLYTKGTAVALLLIVLSLNSCAPRSVFLPESDRLYFPNKGDSIPEGEIVCMYTGTLFELEKEANRRVING